MGTIYKKHFIPLESNPDVFNTLIYLLGSPPSLAFQDVLSLDEPELLPHHVLALILVFPTTDSYEERKVFKDTILSCGDDDDIFFFKQTINNACGLYAILHALSNGEVRDILSESYFRIFMELSILKVDRTKLSYHTNPRVLFFITPR